MWQPPDCVKHYSLAREELPTPISNEPVNITGGDAGAGRHRSLVRPSSMAAEWVYRYFRWCQAGIVARI